MHRFARLGLGGLLVACASLLSGCATRETAPAEVTFEEIAPSVWTHTAAIEIAPWGRVPSSGLIVVSETDILLVDTAWNDAQTNEILDWVEARFERPVSAAVFTHGHDDKMGGVAAVRARGIPTYANALSNVLAKRWNLTPAEFGMAFDSRGALRSNVDLPGLTLFYPGPGHTAGNIVVGVDGTAVLFVGCLVRPGGSQTLGNTNDGDVDHWAEAVTAVTRRFPDLTLVVPSHGAPGTRALLDHTIDLARRAGGSP